MRRTLLAVMALAATTTVGLGARPAWGSHHEPASSRQAADMLVFLRGPDSAHQASRAHITELVRQNDVARTVTSVGAKVLASTDVPDVLFVRATATQLRVLRASPDVEAILPNTKVPGPSVSNALLQPVVAGTGHRGAPLAGPCGTASDPESDPEALTNIDGAPTDTDGYDGAGVTVAILGDALLPSNPDLHRNPAYASAGSAAGTRVVTDFEDFSGDGPTIDDFGGEAFGDASSIAAQGNEVYNLSSFARAIGDPGSLPKRCDIRITGDAPGSSLIALKLFGFSNFALAEQTVQAINYAVAHGAKVISESFGFNNFPDTSEDAVRLADSAAVAAGVTVVVSSGDAGPNSTIASPASDPDVLAVGATTTYRAYSQLTYGGINALNGGDRYVDNNISALSSGGIAFDGKTVNLVAPGDANWALCSISNKFSGCAYQPIELFGGTSESAPLTAGAAADVIQAYEATHGGTPPTPSIVMRTITSTSKDLDAPADQQGAGLLQVGAAVQLAASLPGTTALAPQGGILADTSQLNLTGAPGSTQTAMLGFTNTSTSQVQFDVATRSLVAVSRRFGVTQLGYTTRHLPTFVDGSVQMVMRRVRIAVTSHTSRVQFQMAFPPDQLAAISLFDPHGRLVAYSFPQGYGGFADVEATTSGAGTWTAVVYQPVNGLPATEALSWSVTLWQFEQHAACSPSSLVISPGQHADCQLDVTMPSTGGDTSLAVIVNGASEVLTIPVTLRTQLAVSPGGETTFHGVITGGNGRGGAAAQTDTYSIDVGPGERDLDVGVSLAGKLHRGHPGDIVEAALVDPDGSVAAYGYNVVSRTTSIPKSTRSLQLYVANPVSGSWKLLFVVTQPVVGTHVQLAFTGTIGFNQVSIHSTLPDSATATVPKSGATFTVDLHNTGVAPMFVALDPRTAKDATVTPDGSGFDDLFQVFVVPPMTSSVKVEQTSAIPASFELVASGGDPVITPEGDTPYVTATTSPDAPSLQFAPPTSIETGPWEVQPDPIGPFTKNATREVVTDTLSLRTLGFDPTVRTNVYDVARIETLGTASTKSFFGRYTPTGTIARIAVAIRPSAPAGSIVSGTLLVEDVDEYSGSIELLAALPYKYVAP
jgi:hypothetical protein